MEFVILLRATGMFAATFATICQTKSAGLPTINCQTFERRLESVEIFCLFVIYFVFYFLLVYILFCERRRRILTALSLQEIQCFADLRMYQSCVVDTNSRTSCASSTFLTLLLDKSIRRSERDCHRAHD